MVYKYSCKCFSYTVSRHHKIRDRLCKILVHATAVFYHNKKDKYCCKILRLLLFLPPIRSVTLLCRDKKRFILFYLILPFLCCLCQAYFRYSFQVETISIQRINYSRLNYLFHLYILFPI